MSQRITIEIKNKIATCLTETPIVCGNSDYVVDFLFDEGWDTHEIKTARFKINGEYIDVVFEGNTCNIPVILKAKIIWVGVFAGDLSTTTPAIVHCKPCILDDAGAPAAPTDDVYNQIMDIIEAPKMCILGEGESLEDVPEDADIVIDPEGGVDDVLRYSAQSLSEGAQSQARENIGAASAKEVDEAFGEVEVAFSEIAEVVDTTSQSLEKYKTEHANDYTNEQIDEKIASSGGSGGGGGTVDLTGVLKYTEQTLTVEEQAQARENINATSNEDFWALAYNHSAMTLRWDGYVGDKTVVNFIRESNISVDLIHISDEVPPVEAFAAKDQVGVSLTLYETYPEICYTPDVYTSDDGFIFIVGDVHNRICIVPYDNYTLGLEIGTFTFPKKGVYFSATYSPSISPILAYSRVGALITVNHLHNNAPSYNELKDKPFGEVGGDTLTWDGDVKGTVVEEDEGEHGTTCYVKVSNSVPTLSDIANKNITIVVKIGNEEQKNQIDGNEVEVYNGLISLGYATIIPNDNFVLDDLVFPSKGVYFVHFSSGVYCSRLTIPGYTGFPSVKKIDEKYLPSVTILYADDEKYLYATSDTSDTSRRMTASELKSIALGGSKVLLCVLLTDGVATLEVYGVPVGFSFMNSFGGVSISNEGKLDWFYTAEYDPTATTQEGET